MLDATRGRSRARATATSGAICDTVLRGTHVDVLQRNTGWIIVNPITAEHVDPKTGERTEKSRYLRTETFDGPDGTQQVDIWYIGGRRFQPGREHPPDPARRSRLHRPDGPATPA